MESLMRKYESLAFSAATALTLFLTASCQKEIFQTSDGSASCTVEFSMNEMATKTAMGDKDAENKYHTVWSSDDNARITFYQNGTASESVAISSADNYKHASFTASFSEQGTAPFKYKAILAGTRTADDLPVVPAEQHPTAGSFDPDANVLVGLESEFASKPEKVDLVYMHAAVISRVCFTGIPDDLTIYGVQINAANAIAGAAKSVDYTNGTVDFSDASEKTISLIYDETPSYSDGKFDAYFVAIPGTDVQINDIKLITDKGTFVKNNSNSSKTDFDVNKLKSVNVTVPSARTFYKATSVEAGQNYMIVTASTHALTNNSGSAADTEVSVSDDDSIVLSDPSKLLWNASDSKKFTLKNEDSFVYYSTGSYSPGISLSTSQKLSFNYAGTAFSATINSKEYYLYYSSNSKEWSFGTSDYITNIFTSKLPLNLSFNVTEASYDIDKSTFISSTPILNGASSAVEYTSSNTDVATVNTDGTINAIAVGTTTITASLASNSLYQAVSASYTLNVIDPSKVVTYELANTIESGATYLIVSPAKEHALCYTSSDTKSNYSGVNGTSGTIVVDQSLKDCEFVITQSGDNYTIYNTENKKYLYTKTTYSGTYIGFQTSSFNFTLDTKSDDLFSFKSSVQVNSKDAWLYYNSDNYFKIGGSGKPSTSGSGVYLYKYKDPRTPQNLTFTDTAPTIDLANSTAYKQEVSGAQTTVTYSISTTPSGAATIDATTGTVTATKKGTAVITATAAATTDYQGASATYTLTIIDSAHPDKYYNKVTDGKIIDGGTYLMVDHNNSYAFDASKSDGKYNILVNPSNDKILATDDLASAGVEITLSDEKYYLKTSQGYLYYSSSKISFGQSANTDYLHTISYSSEVFQIVQNRNNFRYSKSGGKFEYNSSSTGSFDIYLLEGSTKLSRDIKFTEHSIIRDLSNTGPINLELIGETGGATVKYESSNEEVASVDNSGTVTLTGKAGSVDITASIDEDDTYRAWSDKCTITVIDPNAKVYYTKVTEALPSGNSNSYPEWKNVLFVHDNGDGTGYVFKGIYNGDASEAPDGKTSTNKCYLETAGNAVKVSITDSGIVASEEVNKCTLTMTFKEDNKHDLKMDEVNGYFRILAGSNQGQFVVMSSAGYRMTYSVSDTNGNNVTAYRKDSTDKYYFYFDGTKFASQNNIEAKFSIYRIVE